MRKESNHYNLWQRLGAMLLAAVLILGMIPANSAPASAAITTIGEVTKLEDPETLTRPQDIYGNNTLNAGKVTVGKSVSKDAITVDGHTIGLTDDNNFLITISQTAQVMGLSSETSVPVDVVFVLDTSGSMNQNGVDRASSMVTAANSAIATLMATNDQNRVAVVAFSSEGYGGGTSGDAAASVLSSLAHYTGAAASNHLQWVDSQGGTTGGSRNYIAGRDQTTITVNNGPGSGQQRTVNAFRDGHDGGTNIQAGIVAGAKILTAVQDKTWTNPETNEVVHRIPFLIILSDGQPTFSYDDDTWYDPTVTGQNAADEQGPGSGAYEGNGFIAALTAAYYKGKITEHYYGDKADADNRCFVYTMGVEIEALDDYESNWGQMVSYVDDSQSLAQITLDPATYAVDGQDYYTYGNTWNSNNYNKNTTNGWKTYWTNYQNGTAFTVRVNDDDEYNDTYSFTADSIANSKKYVNGIGYTGGLAYNDDYFAADDVADMEAVFEALIAEISKKAITVPTKVTTGDQDFDGYVTFTDPLGEYMELKGIRGFVSNGQLYQGANAAQLMASGTNAEFNKAIRNVLKTRLSLNDADDRFADENELNAFIDSLLATADGTNSITWWGSEYPSGKDDHKVQVLAPAEDDSIAYIEEQRAANQIPAGADYVCRSYFFGSADTAQTLGYLAFVVRVERSLKAPYEQTVVISAPASLLSVEKVMINESFDDNGNPVYTASVQRSLPARVVYEVGLWDTINEETVSTIVSESYRTQAVNGEGQVNYDPITDTYYFFTNDWDRSEDNDHHHRALAKATFDAAADNPFYTYQEDTPLVDSNGNPVTSNPAGTTAYYVRTYYEWGTTANSDGTYSATQKTEKIAVEIPSNVNLTPNSDGQYFIPKGTYTASTLVVNGDDTEKTPNITNTAEIVAHPHRTDEDNYNSSHYTVLLGNNGSISLKSNVPEPKKTVSNITTHITDANGKSVMVGEVLEYAITAVNYGVEAGTITITDTVPAGTEFVSATENPVRDGSKLTWTFTNVAPGAEVTVKFQVRVTAEALDNAVVTSTIQNTATVKLNNGPEYKTNTTTNPPSGKKVTIQGENQGSTVQVGDVLEYSIEYHNDTGTVAPEIKIVDKLPAGTNLVTVDHGGVYDAQNHTITWTFTNVAPGAGGVVTFTVQVDASAKTPIENGATINIGNNSYTTNKTSTTLDQGKLVLEKTVVVPGGLSPAANAFALTLTEGSGTLSGSYATTVNGQLGEPVVFTDGVATVEIRHGQTITIEGLATGTTIRVTESVPGGFKAAFSGNGMAVIPANGEAKVTVTNTYSVTNLEVILQGNKTLNGSSPDDERFGFTVVPCSAEGVVDAGATGITGEVTLTKDTKAITFSKLTFTAPGTYHYLVSEVNGGQTGVTYTETQYLVTIKVIDNGAGALVQDGSTVIQSRSGSTGAFSAYTGTMLFTNEYKPLSTSVTLEGTKTLTGRKLQPGEFSFVVTENGAEVSTGTNDANGKITFRPITYTAAGTHTYTVSELAGNLPGVTYAQNTYTVTVKVEDVDGQLVATVTGGDGITFANSFEPKEVAVTLAANKELIGPDGNAVTLSGGEFSFVVKDLADNQVASGSNDANGKITFSKIEYFLKDMKDAQGNILTSKVFQYQITELKPDSGVDPSMFYDGLVIDVSVTVSYNTATGELKVDKVEYSADTTFNNKDNPDTITVIPQGEKSTHGITGVLFSFSVYTVDQSAPNMLGSLVSSGTVGCGEEQPITFAGITYGYDDLDKDANGDYVETNYCYWILEDRGGTTNAGITYDGAKYLMVVTLNCSDTNKLTADVRYFDTDDPADFRNRTAKPSFVNEYNVTTGTQVTMQVKKNLEGRELKAGEFEFGLYHIENAKENLVATVTNDANGLVTFIRDYAATILAQGQDSREIHYVIRELDDKIHGVNYTEALNNPIYVKVVVTDLKNGTMSNTVKYYSDAAMQTEIATPTFTNTYTPDPAEVTFVGNKVLTGPDGDTVSLSGGEFSFVVIDAAGNEVAWGSNDANGKITFSKIVYTYERFLATADPNGNAVFTYTVKEVIPDIGVDSDLKYDTDTFQVAVTVRYNSSTGELTASASYEKPVEFYNNPATIAVKPEGYKVITADANVDIPEKLKFSFRVRYMGTEFSTLDQNGPVVATGVSQGVNFAKDAIDFTELVFDYDDVGSTFYYLLEEVTDSANGIGYTDAKYVMAVTISTDNVTGALKADVQYQTLAGTDVQKDQILFENKVQKVIKTLSIQGTKVLSGKTLRDGMFDFRLQLLKADGTLTSSVVDGVNAADGTINFGTLVFTAEAGHLNTATKKETNGNVTVYEYHVLVSELKPASNAIPGVTYSTQLYIAEITWTATDNGNGQISYDEPIVKAIYEAKQDGAAFVRKNDTNLLDSKSVKDALTFTNVYTITTGTSATMKVQKLLENRILQAGEFTFGLYHLHNNEETLVLTATNAADGTVTFTRSYAPSVLTTHGGQIQYVIRELPGNAAGVDYSQALDNPVYVTVTVADDNMGGLELVSVTYTDKQGNPIQVDEDTFPTFTNIYIPDPAEVTLTGEKNLTGSTLKAGQFSFVVKEGETEVAWGSNDASGKITFTKIVYTYEQFQAADTDHDNVATFTYTIQEVIPDVGADPSMYYDPTTYTVTVTVTYNPSTGALTATHSDLSGVEFNNVDNPDTITVTPAGKKTTDVISGNIPEGTTFSYTIYELNADGSRGAAVGAGTSGINDDITFSTLLYGYADAGKTFKYVIVEDNGGSTNAGITYDDAVFEMTVQIGVDEKNALTKTVSYNVSEVKFNNEYKVTQPATVTIKADKLLTGRDLRPGEFGFNLYHLHNGGETPVAATTNGEGGAISFSRTYDPSILLGEHGNATHDAATIYYVIREQVNNLGGVDYSQAKPVYVKVVITAGTDGTMTAVPTYYSDAGFTTEITDPTFTNSYETTDKTFEPKVYKVLTGRHMADDEFSFVIKDLATGQPVSYGLSKKANSGEASAIVFNKITYTYQQFVAKKDPATGVAVFTYEISEIPGNLVNVTYTPAKIYLQVTVTDKGDGTLEVSEKYYANYENGVCRNELTGSAVKFENSYEAIGTTVTLEAEKALLGRKMVDGEFSFVVKSGSTVVATGGNVGDKVHFSGIGIDAKAFKDADTDGDGLAEFVFTVEELKTNQGAMTFDSSIYYAKVTVTNDLAAGKLNHSVAYYSDAECQNQLSGTPWFTNEYDPAPAKVVIPVHKNLVNHTLEAGMFEFIMTMDGQQVSDITNDANGNAIFDVFYPVSVLDGVAPGPNNVRTRVFTYTLSEVAGTADSADDNGTYSYDDTVYTVTVTVTDNGKGELSADVSIRKDQIPVEQVIFTNTFTPDPIEVDLDTAIEATKTVVDNEGNVLNYKLEGHQFRVTDLNGNPVKDADGNDIVGVSGADGKISFAEFPFRVEGEYRYLLQEIIPDEAVLNPNGTYSLDGMTYDATVWCVHIRVRYNPDNGKLSVSDDDVYTHVLSVESHAEDGIQAQAEEAPAFVNVYNADDVRLQLTLDKTITGDRTEVKEHEFLFRLLNADGTIAGEARNHLGGVVSFYLDYDLQDLKGQTSRDFTYTVKEVIPEGAVKNADGTYTLNGVTYDNRTHTVTVTLSDNGKGELVTTMNGDVVAGKVDTGIDFVNKYEAADVTVTFHAIKRMEGMPLENGIYTFLLKDGDEILAKGTNKADGTVSFDKELTYTEPGTHTYTMVEYKDAKPGVTFDETSFKVTVEVTDNGKGNLVAKVIYTTEEGTYDQPVFVNIYKPAGIGAVIEAHKELDGRDMKADEFTFQLLDDQGTVISQAKNDADGKITFVGQNFNTVGTYTYTIREVIPADAVKNADGTYTWKGVTYDQTVYTVVVEVTDPGFDGQLDKKVTYYLGTQEVDAAKVIFTNTYEADAASADVAAKKELTGKNLEKGQFSFVLVNKANKNESYTVTNGADGAIVFEDLLFTEAGTYTYELYEVKGTDAHITYDDTVYTVTVTVTDDLQGKLEAKVAYSAESVVFTNIHTPDPITVVLEGSKELIGRDQMDGEFDFEVRDDKGNLVTTGTNKADGTIVFEGITVETDTELTLSVTEVKGDDKQIEYDDYVYRVKLTVTNDNGVLKADVQYLDGDIVFYNEYEIPETPPTGDDTPLHLYIGLMLTSAVALMAVLVLGRKKKARKHF